MTHTLTAKEQSLAKIFSDDYMFTIPGYQRPYGIWQSDSGVRHLVAKRLVDLSRLLGEIPTKSRDFQ